MLWLSRLSLYEPCCGYLGSHSLSHAVVISAARLLSSLCDFRGVEIYLLQSAPRQGLARALIFVTDLFCEGGEGLNMYLGPVQYHLVMYIDGTFPVSSTCLLGTSWAGQNVLLGSVQYDITMYIDGTFLVSSPVFSAFLEGKTVYLGRVQCHLSSSL